MTPTEFRQLFVAEMGKLGYVESWSDNQRGCLLQGHLLNQYPKGDWSVWLSRSGKTGAVLAEAFHPNEPRSSDTPPEVFRLKESDPTVAAKEVIVWLSTFYDHLREALQ